MRPQEDSSSSEGEAVAGRAELQVEEGSLADPDNDDQDEEEGGSPKG